MGANVVGLFTAKSKELRRSCLSRRGLQHLSAVIGLSGKSIHCARGTFTRCVGCHTLDAIYVSAAGAASIRPIKDTQAVSLIMLRNFLVNNSS